MGQINTFNNSKRANALGGANGMERAAKRGADLESAHLADTAVQTFNFEGQPLNVLMRDGEPWWPVAEITKLLGIKRNAHDFAKYLDPAESATWISSSRSENGVVQRRTRIHVNESGLYSLIFKSNKPEAKRFRLWVTSEVLPSIRGMPSSW